MVDANGGVVTNTGLEFDLRVNWIRKDDLQFTTSFNVARNKNVIVRSFHNYDSYKEAIKNQPSKGGVINIIGKEVGSIFGFKNAGVNPTTGNSQYYLTEDAKVDYARILDRWWSLSPYDRAKYSEIIKDFDTIPDKVDMIASENSVVPDFYRTSLQYLGRTNPLLVGGFSTYLKYRRFEFSTMWSYKLGHIVPLIQDYANAPLAGLSDRMTAEGYSTDLGVSHTNRERRYLGYWKREGDITDIPKFVTGNFDLWVSSRNSDNYAKGDYLRLTNLSLSYRFDPNLLKKWNMNVLQLSLTTRNLLTFTRYRGLDVATGGAFNYPVAREASLKLTVGI